MGGWDETIYRGMGIAGHGLNRIGWAFYRRYGMTRVDAARLNMPEDGDVAAWRAEKARCHSWKDVEIVDDCFDYPSGRCFVRLRPPVAKLCGRNATKGLFGFR